ncbi:hypothetical protein BKA61DRAFT_256860 [Leptodontidium sp. MPI-SDFR-AT-0119]|nr:hypothetical protein BKA61DRAFT_256860 [Leptodontidium sp. MPI-SDFR-AT-0119]
MSNIFYFWNQLISPRISYQSVISYVDFCVSHLPPPAYRTIYPLQHGTPVLNDRGEIPIKHNSFMCIAVQNFTGNRALNERDLKVGKLLSIILSKTGWWFAISHDTRGGMGWVPAIYLEKYNPTTDPRVYYDKAFSSTRHISVLTIPALRLH